MCKISVCMCVYMYVTVCMVVCVGEYVHSMRLSLIALYTALLLSQLIFLMSL